MTATAPTPPAAAQAPITWADPARHAAFDRWLAEAAAPGGWRLASLRAASADASARRYFRLDGPGGATAIVMDAPPHDSDSGHFLALARRIREAGLHAPEVLAADAAQGFALLEDVGPHSYLDALREADTATAQRLMRDAIRALVHWQQHLPAGDLPPYDDALLRRELALFPEWCVQREHGITWGPTEQARWQKVCDLLVASALAQPVVPVHRDYMVRNLMVSDPNPAVLDFQDAVRGPLSYDIASLIRDAFFSWEEEQEIDWAVRYWDAARQAGLAVPEDFGEFWRQVEWMGLQRHLKVMGIFCRLKHRDGKPHYREDLPRFIGYATKVAMRYRPLAELLPLLEPLGGHAVARGYTF
ncbi:aminoglycoside phosphotransferase family protein [Ideonella sp.]|uniref:aminoglycoside phosphotransferase family protein n=1 Tax=Ideonella sp. TaxID=1929293 RepID=UPI0035AF3EF4